MMFSEDDYTLRAARIGRYKEFCKNNYVPIYSKPWWMDAVCGSDNWDAKVFEKEGNIIGAIAFYIQMRGGLKYITKAPLTQSNGIIFSYPPNLKKSSIGAFEERVINEACDYIESLGLDVYEQQYSVSFTNWSPFSWRGYTAIPRYTYIFKADELLDIDRIWNDLDKKKKRNIVKGQGNCSIKINALSAIQFYEEVEKVYDKQGIECPFSFELWNEVYLSAISHNSGHILSAHNEEGIVLATKFLVWDEKTMYALISGGDQKYQKYETKSALDWFAICDAANRHLNYDFEGSMIERIVKAYRGYGATPYLYFRIRKLFNPKIIRMEAEQAVLNIG